MRAPGACTWKSIALGQYMVAAIAYAENSGRELPPETIAVDLGATEDAPPEFAPGGHRDCESSVRVKRRRAGK